MGKSKITLATSAALMNAVTVGICSTYSSTATESMRSSSLNPSDAEISWIGSTFPLGAIFGGIIAGYLADKIGRKGVMMHLSVLLLVGWLLIAYATSLPFIYCGRFITGLCCGLICVVTPMYIVEIAPPDIRGTIGCRFQLYICIGIVLVSSAGKFLEWNWVAIGASFVAVLAPVCILFIPESPCWLLKNEKHAQAASSIRFLYGDNWEISSQFIYDNYRESPKNIRIDITHPTIYKPTLLSVGLMFLQQFSGSNAILYYTVKIFKEAKTSLDPSFENVFVALIMFSFTAFSSVFMDKIGRKISLIISGVSMCVTLNILSVYLMSSHNNPSIKDMYGWIPLMCMLGYIAAFSVGFGPIPWLMMSEMSPTHARSLVCGIGTAFSWIFTFVITWSFLYIEHAIMDYGAYWFYSTFCLLGCFFTFLLPETKGKSFEEIEAFFCSSEAPIQRLEDDKDEEMITP